MIYGARVDNLTMFEGQCVGVSFEQEERSYQVSANAVVMADGGFQSNHELLGEFVTPRPERLLQRNVGNGTGDAICMARKVGAKLVGMDCFYGHLLSRDAFNDERLWPYPQLDPLAFSGIVVDGSGRRIVDEGMGGTYMANMLARRPDPADALVIFDDIIWNGPGADLANPPAANPTLTNLGATIFVANTIAQLAILANIPADALTSTVCVYNAALSSGKLQELVPPRTLDGGQHVASKKPYPIMKPPFYAVPACSGITYTMGGLATDADARVLDADSGTPIPNLFAAGACTGGLEGGPLAGYVGGISKALIFGLRAAERIARDQKGL